MSRINQHLVGSPPTKEVIFHARELPVEKSPKRSPEPRLSPKKPLRMARGTPPVSGESPRHEQKSVVQQWVVFDKKIATIDIETLGKGLNAVVTQIGLIVTDRVPLLRPDHWEYDQKWEPLVDLVDAGAEGSDYHLSVAQQILDKGRTTEPDTLKWWKEDIQKSGESPSLFYVFNGREEVNDELRTKIVSALDEAEYIWVNHPEFDLPRLESLFGAPVWSKYRNVLDVSNVREQLRAMGELPASGVEFGGATFKKHDAMQDCAWNLHVVAHGARIFDARNSSVLFRGPRWQIEELTAPV